MAAVHFDGLKNWHSNGQYAK